MKNLLILSFVITRYICFLYFRIQTLIHVYVGFERKEKIDVDHISKDNDSTSESKFLNN